MASATDPSTEIPSTEAAPSHANAFGLLRLILASTVILQHALDLTGHKNDTFLGLGHRVSIGDLAVGGFFGVSGYLLQSSVVRHAPRRYLRLRFYRLFPGFWTTLLVVAFLAGPIAAWLEGTLRTYPLVGQQSAVTYVFFNSSLVMLQHNIGTLLGHIPWPAAFDGSLWSLAPEFACYLVLLGATVVARRRGWASATGLGIVVAGSAAGFVAGRFAFGGLGAQFSLLCGLAFTFFTGSLIATRGWLAEPHPRRALVLVGLSTMMVALGLWVPIGPPLLAATVVAFGLSFNRGWPTRADARADLSYGIYLYHFPVIQLLVLSGMSISATSALLVIAPCAALIASALATASWFLVEAPAQRRGRRRPSAGATGG